MDKLDVSTNVSLPVSDVSITQIRASGPGGQNVNKVSSAVHLRFDIKASSLPEFYKQRLLEMRDRRITSDGVAIIKAVRYRSFEKNRDDALARLVELIQEAGKTRKARRPTRPGKAAKRRRLDAKSKRSHLKTLRKRVGHDD